jgi:hypothetical protein
MAGKRHDFRAIAACLSHVLRTGNAMTYLAQALGINLMGVVSGRSAAELARWNQILRLRESMQGQKTGR